MAEYAILGRTERFVGDRVTDTDPDSPTLGKRVYTDAVTEKITEYDKKGKPVEREVLVKGRHQSVTILRTFSVQP